MRCPSCGHENPANSKFCLQCGGKLASRCPECGVVLPAGSKFCNECGQPVEPGVPQSPAPDPRSYTPKHLAEKILTSRSALEGERKQVTVLFADVQGSVALSESVDPETLHKVMDRFFVILADGVHRFEGTVNQYTGDGIMALFGAPIAHEDHGRRACYTALHLRDELRRYADELRLSQGLNFSVRMGLNSGEVVVGKIGDDLRMDYTAQGATVGLAARMEQIAEARSIYLTERTAQLVEGFFRLRDLGPLTVKGVQDTLRVYELQGVGELRTRLDLSRARGFSKFVGRTNETAALEAALERAVQGNGQVVGVVGEAGVGKSRLCYEFVQRCRARGLMVNEAHGVAHGKAIPFLMVLEFFRGYFGITDQDGDEMARDKIAGRLLRLDEQFSEALPLLFDFLGVPDPARPVQRMDPEARQRQLFEMTRQLIRARSQREAAVTLLEDLHWIDGGTEAFVGTLVEVLPGTRTLVLVNYRPEYRADWMQRSYYQQLPLTPLGPEAISELLRDLLGTDPSLAGLGDRIQERTGGNPFFIEEVVQSLIEAGSLEGTSGAYRLANPVDEVSIPARVQSVLAARIDRLTESEKAVLQMASVVGRTFSEPVLRSVGELTDVDFAASLSSLQRGEFIYEEAVYPEAVYAFKHALTQEVAYGSQLTERRARVHAAVARTITELYPDRLDEQAALVAHHWEEAGQALEAARLHSRAAEWAGTSHLAEALGHWRKVSILLDKVPESAETVALGVAARIQILMLGWRLGALEEEADAIFAEGRALAERASDVGSLAWLTSSYGGVKGFAGNMEAFLEHTTAAARLADQTNDAGLKLNCRNGLLFVHWYEGRLHEGLRVADSMLAETPEDLTLGADIAGHSPYMSALWLRGVIAGVMGRHDEAELYVDRSAQLARQHGRAENLGWAHGSYVWLAQTTGRTETALGHARRAVEIAEKIASSLSRSLAYESLGGAHILTGEWSEAVGALERALVIVRETRTGLHREPHILGELAEAYVGLGDNGRAHATADQAVAVAGRRGTKFFECLAHLARARVLLKTDCAQASGEIQTALRAAMVLVEETGARAYEPFVYEERANLARLMGDHATQQRELREAHRLFTEMSATGHAERLAKELGL